MATATLRFRAGAARRRAASSERVLLLRPHLNRWRGRGQPCGEEGGGGEQVAGGAGREPLGDTTAGDGGVLGEEPGPLFPRHGRCLLFPAQERIGLLQEQVTHETALDRQVVVRFLRSGREAEGAIALGEVGEYAPRVPEAGVRRLAQRGRPAWTEERVICTLGGAVRRQRGLAQPGVVHLTGERGHLLVPACARPRQEQRQEPPFGGGGELLPDVSPERGHGPPSTARGIQPLRIFRAPPPPLPPPPPA